MPARPRVDRLKTIYSAAKHLNFGFRLADYPSAPAFNGVSSFQPQLHRITFRFCKQSESSVGMRNYIEHCLVQFAKENPTTVAYVVPGRQCIPTLRAEYANGRMVHINAKNFTAEQLQRHVNNLKSRSGLPIVKFESVQTAQCKSVQGQWTPLLWRDPRQNAVQLPHPDFSKHKSAEMSATEFILQNVVCVDAE